MVRVVLGESGGAHQTTVDILSHSCRMRGGNERREPFSVQAVATVPIIRIGFNAAPLTGKDRSVNCTHKGQRIGYDRVDESLEIYTLGKVQIPSKRHSAL
jgi:hypothetical protein